MSWPRGPGGVEYIIHHSRSWQDWVAVAVLLLTLSGYFVHLEHRITLLEQKVDDITNLLIAHMGEIRK